MVNRLGTGVVGAVLAMATALASAPPATSAPPHVTTAAESGDSSAPDALEDDWAPTSRHRPENGTLTVVGRGHGHGRGMSQWGAYTAGKGGRSARAILRFYYPGTQLVRAGTGGTDLRVRLLHDGSPILVRPESGLALWWTAPSGRVDHRVLPRRHAGCAVTTWRVRRSGPDLVLDARGCGRWRTFLPSNRIERGGRVSFVPDDGAFSIRRRAPGYDHARREYRGALRATIADGQLRAINHVPYEQYLRSVVPAESPASWPQPTLRAQAIAARTYARWWASRRASGYFDVYGSTSSQSYHGIRAFDANWRPTERYEHARSDRAVRATAGMILRYRGRAALTEYSTSNGGRTTAGDMPYVVARADPWDRRHNPDADWTRTVRADRLEQRYPEIGRLRGVRLTGRAGGGTWGGRVGRAVLIGSKGDRVIEGQGAVTSAFGLPSAWFTFRSGG